LSSGPRSARLDLLPVALDQALAHASGLRHPDFVLTLGPPIRPPRLVPTGPGVRRAARVWADIDLLGTSDSITEAVRLTKNRHARSEMS
jgi:hypothetical protein